MPDLKEPKSYKRGAWACFAIAVAVLAAMAWITWSDWKGTAADPGWANPGIRGDFLGGHLSAGTGLAGVLLFVAALLLQMHELKLQRIELAESRRVAEEQARALEKQTIELKQQNTLTQERDELQLMLSLAEHYRENRDKSKIVSELIVTAIRHAAQRATVDPVDGLYLLRTFCAACTPYYQGVEGMIESEASQYDEISVDQPVPGFTKPWRELARCAFDLGNTLERFRDRTETESS